MSLTESVQAGTPQRDPEAITGMAEAQPLQLSAAMDQADVLLNKGRATDALTLLRSYLPSHPHDLKLLLALSRVAKITGRRQAALQYMEQALQIAPENVPLLLDLAGQKAAAGETATARSYLERLLRVEPRHTEALVMLGQMVAGAGDHAEARKHLERAWRLAPHRVRPWSRFFHHVRTHEGPSEATRPIHEAWARSGYTEAIAEAWLQVFDDQGLQADYEGELARALAAFPQSERLRLRAVRHSTRCGRFAEALHDIGLLPAASTQQQQEIALLRARVARARGDLDAADAELRRILDKDPKHLAAHAERAALLTSELDADQATGHLRIFREGKIISRSTGKPAQRFLRSLVDDLLMDRASLDASRDALRRGAVQDAVKILADHPGYTGAALAALHCLRRQANRRPSMGAGSIPQTVFQLWPVVPVSPDAASLARSWQAMGDGWNYEIFDNLRATQYVRRHGDFLVNRAFAQATPEQRASIFRLVRLDAEGGVYARSDTRCLAPISHLLDGADLVVSDDALGLVQDHFIAARAGHPAIGHALRQIVSSVLRGDKDAEWLATGTGCLTRAVALALAETTPDRSQTLILRQEELRRYSFTNCLIPKSQGDPGSL